MPMTKDDTLSPLAKLLLETLQATGGAWLTRLEIAQKIGRPDRLIPRDIDMLNLLVTRGLVEVQNHPRGPIQAEYIYRVKLRE